MKKNLINNLILVLIILSTAACIKSEPAIPTNTVTFENVGDPNAVVFIYKEHVITELTPATRKISLKVPVDQKIYLRRYKGNPSLKTTLNGKKYIDVNFENNGKYEFIIN